MDFTNDILENSRIDDTESSEIRKSILEQVVKYSKIAHKKKNFIPGKTMIPVSGKVFDETELQFLISSSLDFWLTSDRFNKKFETNSFNTCNWKW